MKNGKKRERESVKGVSAKSGARESERRAWQEEAERWEGCSFQKGRINEKGLRIVQPKNRENRGRESRGERGRERVGP